MSDTKCKHCKKPIHRTKWKVGPRWSHGPRWEMNQPNCVSTTQAEPVGGDNDE